MRKLTCCVSGHFEIVVPIRHLCAEVVTRVSGTPPGSKRGRDPVSNTRSGSKRVARRPNFSANVLETIQGVLPPFASGAGYNLKNETRCTILRIILSQLSYRGTSLIRKRNPQDPTVGLCLGS